MLSCSSSIPRSCIIYLNWNSSSLQMVILASIAMTVYLRTRMGVDIIHANYYLGALFYGLVILFFDGYPELAMTVARLPIFYKQRDLYFYPAWAYAIPAIIIKIPLSVLEALIWTSLTYYVIGYTPEVGRLVSLEMTEILLFGVFLFLYSFKYISDLIKCHDFSFLFWLTDFLNTWNSIFFVS